MEQFSHSNALLREDTGAESLHGSIVMVPDISQRLSGLLSDFLESVPLKEMELERLPLVCSDFVAETIEKIFGNHGVNEQGLRASTYALLFKFANIVMLPHGKILPTIESSMVGDLNDPGRGSSFARIKELQPSRTHK